MLYTTGMEGKLSSTRTARLIRALARNEWSDEARAASAKKRKERAKSKGSWWSTAGKAALIGGGALAGSVLGAKGASRFLSRGRLAKIGENLTGKLLYTAGGRESSFTPATLIKFRGRTLDKPIEELSKRGGARGAVGKVIRKIDEALQLKEGHYGIGIDKDKVASFTPHRGQGQVLESGKDFAKTWSGVKPNVRVVEEGSVAGLRGKKRQIETKKLNDRWLNQILSGKWGTKDWSCTGKNCEVFARTIAGQKNPVSREVRAIKAGLAGGAALGATPGVAMSIPRKKKVTQNKWSEAARKKSAESRKRKAMSSTKKGALIGAGVAGGLNTAAQVRYSNTLRSLERSAVSPHGFRLSPELVKSLKLPLKTRAAGLGAALALGGLAGAGIGRLLRRKQQVQNILQVINGGPGSGFHGHKGIKGHRGGSMPEGGGAPSMGLSVRSQLIQALGPPALSETPQARAKRTKAVFTKARGLADVYESYAGELERKRRRKFMPLKKPELEDLVRAHSNAAANFYSSADQATLVKGHTTEEQVERLRKADHHAQLAMKYTKRLGYNPKTGRPLPNSALGDFSRSVGKAFVSGLSGAVHETAYKAGRATTKAAFDVAGEAVRGGIRGGQKASEEKSSLLKRIESEFKRAEGLHGGAKNLVEGKARDMEAIVPTFKDLIKSIARGTGTAAKERATAHKGAFLNRPSYDQRLDITRGLVGEVLEREKELKKLRKYLGLRGGSREERPSANRPSKPIPQTIGAGGQPVTASNKDIEETSQQKAQRILDEAVGNQLTANFNSVVTNLAGQVRRATLHGKDYLVAPLSMIVPGVLPGSKGALLYPEDEVRKNPSAWNNIPIVVNHPMKDGIPIEARSPDILEKYQIGNVFNANYRGKLVAEGWFDVERTRKVNTGVYDMLLNGRPIELSTGLYTDNEPFEGTWNGRDYKYIARNYRPDHLAILLTSKGACSLKDGCGVLINREQPTDNIVRKIKGGFKLVSHKGKNLGTAKTKAGIMKRERQVEYFKHVKNEHICNEIRAMVHNVPYDRLAKPWKAIASHLGSAGKIAGVEAFHSIKKIKNPVKAAKSAGSNIVSFTKKRPKTALGITGIASYKYGRRKERKKNQRQMVSNIGFLASKILGKPKKGESKLKGYARTAHHGAMGASSALAGGIAGGMVGSVGGPIGALVGASAGSALGGWMAHRSSKQYGKKAATASGIGGLAGAVATPGGVGRGISKVATGAAGKTGSFMGRAGSAIKRAFTTKAGAGAAAKGVGKMGLDAGTFAGTTAALDKGFGPKQRKPRPMQIQNAWTAEARRKSAETRKRNAAAKGGMNSGGHAAGGLAAGIVVARVAGGKIEKGLQFSHIKTGAREVRRVVKRSFEPAIKYKHDPLSGRNIMYRQPVGVGRKTLRLLKRIRPRIGTLLRMVRK